MHFIITVIMMVVAYLLGSLSAAIIVSRYLGMDDPRTYGSGNPGASNMLRSGRKDAAAWTLAGDALKGLVAVWLASGVQHLFDMGDGIVAWAAIAVVLGHMYPFFFHFKGGKGVATALGVILGMSFWTTFWAVAIWLVIAVKFKKSSLAALVAAVCAPFISFIVQGDHPKLSWALMLIAILVLYRHQDNIRRLMAGNELGIGEAAKPLKDGVVQTAESDDAVLDKTIQEEIAQAEELVESVEEKAKETMEAAKESAEKTVEKVKESAESAVEQAKESAEHAVEKVKESVEKAKESAESAVEKAKESAEHAVEKVKESAEKAKESAEVAVEKVKESAEQTVEKAKESAERATETAKELSHEAVANVKESVEHAKAEVKNAIHQPEKNTQGEHEPKKTRSRKKKS